MKKENLKKVERMWLKLKDVNDLVELLIIVNKKGGVK